MLLDRFWRFMQGIFCEPIQPYVPAWEGKISFEELYALLSTIVMPGHKWYLADEEYRCIPKPEMERWLAEDKLNYKEYIPIIYDCDDFSFELMGRIRGYAVGIIWTLGLPGHALNCFIDPDHKFWLIEPQTDKIFELPKDWNVQLIIF